MPEQAHEVAKAEQAFPGKTVDVGRARTEMFHRYLAGTAVVLLLLLQFSIGVANVWFQLPLWLAVAHNAGAALLLGAVVVLNFFAFRKLRS